MAQIQTTRSLPKAASSTRSLPRNPESGGSPAMEIAETATAARLARLADQMEHQAHHRDRQGRFVAAEDGGTRLGHIDQGLVGDQPLSRQLGDRDVHAIAQPRQITELLCRNSPSRGDHVREYLLRFGAQSLESFMP